MSSKKVSDLIIEKFVDTVTKDALFLDISQELTSLFRSKTYSKGKIEEILKKKENENS